MFKIAANVSVVLIFTFVVNFIMQGTIRFVSHKHHELNMQAAEWAAAVMSDVRIVRGGE